MNTFLTSVLSSVVTSTILLAASGWILRTLIEKKLDSFYKERELSLSEIINRRAEIAADVYLYVKKTCGGGGTLGDLANPRLEIQVACWFPDQVYIAFRDFVVKLLVDPSGKTMSWTGDAEPLLQKVLQAIRPDSRILQQHGATLGKNEFRFLPNITVDEAQQPPAGDQGQRA
jgi:hypothetical protein